MSFDRLTQVAVVLSLCLFACACISQVPARSSQLTPTDSLGQILDVPVTDSAGHIIQLKTRVCRPAGDSPARLVVINHGSPPNAAARPWMQLGRCSDEAAHWFLSRGYIVAFPLRRGYGATGGAWAETYGTCANANYVNAGLETARDISAAVDYLTALPFVRAGCGVIVGQSAGGWGAIAYDSIAHPKVTAFVVFAGGRGGHENDVPDENCRPDRLAEGAEHFGTTASTPMLWVYAANDSFFPPPIARAMYQSFTAAGGKAEIEQPPAFDGDGHRLFSGRGGSAIWGPMVVRYLSAVESSAPVSG